MLAEGRERKRLRRHATHADRSRLLASTLGCGRKRARAPELRGLLQLVHCGRFGQAPHECCCSRKGVTRQVSQGVTASLAKRSAGSFVASPGSAACTPAAAGFYVAASGATSDTACPTGTATTTAGQTECAALPNIFAITSVKALKTGRIRIGLAASATGSFEGQLGGRTIKETTTKAGPLTITLAAHSARA